MEEVVEGEDHHDATPTGASTGSRATATAQGGGVGVGRRLLVRNTLATGFSKILVAATAIVTTPFLLHHLGPDQYGIWLLATTLTFDAGYLGLADLGLRQAAVRRVAEALGRRDRESVVEIVSTATLFFAILGIALGAALALSAETLVGIFEVPEALRPVAIQVFLLVGLEIALDLPAAGLQALIEGSQRYAVLRLIEVGGRVAWAVVVVVLVGLGLGVVAVAAVALAVAAVQLLATTAFARRVDPHVRIRPSAADWRTLRSLTGTASSLLVLRLTSVIWRQMDRIIIGLMLATSAVARYEVAYKVHAVAALVLSIAPSAVMPASAHLAAAGDRRSLRELYLDGTKYAVALSMPVAIAGLLFARPIIRGWVGEAYTDLTGVTRLFLVYPAIVAVHQVGLTILVGTGRVREMIKLNVAAVALNLAVSIWLVGRLGLAGVVWGTLSGFIILWLPYTRLFLHEFTVSTSEWFRRVAWPNLPGLAVQLALGVLLQRAVDDTGNLLVAGAAVALSSASSVVVFVTLVLRPHERATMFATLRRAPSASSPS